MTARIRFWSTYIKSPDTLYINNYNQDESTKLKTYQRKWKEHVERMQDETPPKLPLKYQPVGKRNRGHPKKRWKDQFLEES
jgi:hypothetical protein